MQKKLRNWTFRFQRCRNRTNTLSNSRKHAIKIDREKSILMSPTRGKTGTKKIPKIPAGKLKRLFIN